MKQYGLLYSGGRWAIIRKLDHNDEWTEVPDMPWFNKKEVAAQIVYAFNFTEQVNFEAGLSLEKIAEARADATG